MKAYELLYFVDPAATEEARAGVSKRIDVAVTENGVKIDNVEDWGKRKLAFEIDKLTEGDYTLVDFHADPAQIAEFDRVLRINDAVKRHMIVRRTDRDSFWQCGRARPRTRGVSKHEYQQGEHFR